uniref:Uncharacterized protein n=1 Tax=Amphimedon queenslandica TaxID=400682 RepID=A0A1X7V6S0_AMPQE
MYMYMYIYIHIKGNTVQPSGWCLHQLLEHPAVLLLVMEQDHLTIPSLV